VKRAALSLVIFAVVLPAVVQMASADDKISKVSAEQAKFYLDSVAPILARTSTTVGDVLPPVSIRDSARAI